MTQSQDARKFKQRVGDFSDVIIAYITAGAILVLLAVFAVFYQRGTLLWPCLLSGVTGSALGWVVGIALSPYDQEERASFSHVGKLVYGFLAGYAVSKIDPIITNVSKALSEKNGISFAASGDLIIYSLIGLTAFLAAGAVTYISRRYTSVPSQ